MTLLHGSLFSIAPQASVLTRTMHARSRRVYLLAGLVLLLSIGDLITTLLLLQSTGMEEANPIAAFVMASGSVTNLIIFKMGSVFTSVSVMLLLRHRWQGELAAWVAAIILAVLTFHWYQYTSHFAMFDNSLTLVRIQSHDTWTAWMK